MVNNYALFPLTRVMRNVASCDDTVNSESNDRRRMIIVRNIFKSLVVEWHVIVSFQSVEIPFFNRSTFCRENGRELSFGCNLGSLIQISDCLISETVWFGLFQRKYLWQVVNMVGNNSEHSPFKHAKIGCNIKMHIHSIWQVHVFLASYLNKSVKLSWITKFQSDRKNKNRKYKIPKDRKWQKLPS